ncbi:MAG: hypothetical protein HYZ90_05045 [Candidatus Omnitrophica bacterium]|nr:hypothetical protein [Candidatus Omnitrophota bacterium]
MATSDDLKECLRFLDRQRLMTPSVNGQIGFDFQGLRQSYLDNPKHPDARFIARFGRIWIYDVALSIYADLKAGRFRSAGYQAGRVMQVALQEEEKGFRGLWHFSYNTQGDLFIDPRGPTGANAWCLNAIYSTMISAGDSSALSWANRMVKEYLFPQQVMEKEDTRFGLVRAGLHNADDAARGDGMGYRVYEGRANHPYQHCILEHNADAAGTFRLAFRASRHFGFKGEKFLEELIHRHDLLMKGIRRIFWQGDHFVSALDGEGRLFTGTDGQPSLAVDNNTWAAHVFLPYDLEMSLSSIRYVEKKFLIQTPPALLEDAHAPASAGLHGLYYFTAAFVDPFVQVAEEDRGKMEHLLHPEAAFGFVLFLKEAAERVGQPQERERLMRRAMELYDQTVRLQRLYGSGGAPYASANVPRIFSTLHSVTTAASGAIAAGILQGARSDDFIGVVPPPEFSVDGKSPEKAAS